MGRPETVIRRAANEISKIRGVSIYGSQQWPTTPPPRVLSLDFGPAARWDSDTFYSSAEPSRITIPNNLAGRYRAQAMIMWSRGAGGTFTVIQRDGNGPNSGYFSAAIVANGSTPSPRENLSVAAVVANATRTTHSLVWETDLASGDYLELSVVQNVIGVDTSLPPHSDVLTVEANITVTRLGISA